MILRITLVFVMVSIPAFAADWSEKVQIHGFGSWFYGQTDNNNIFYGSEDGEYRNTHFALAIAANPMARLHVFSQVFGDTHQ